MAEQNIINKVIKVKEDNIIYTLYNQEYIQNMINDKYDILNYYKGHIPSLGKSAKQERNAYMLIKNKETNEEIYAMFCEEDKITFFDKQYLDIILKQNCNKIIFK
jgi:hypothetical protein